jgi:aspartate kinase
VSKGEMLSTTVLFHYLLDQKVDVSFINARYLIKTDNNYTDANILWNETEEAVKACMKETKTAVIITQGFIGANSEMLYTTLGREGSDYTAAILAKCTDTKEMTIWKDVDGVYTGDPKKFPEATIIDKLSYKEAIEMTFYGAQIIHPKTIKPIQNSNCILRVKSFINKTAKGTEIGQFENIQYSPVTVLKEQQVLYSFAVRDFSFLNESNLGKIIATFGKYSLRINLMQNSSIEFIVLTDEKLGKNELILEDLKNDFEIKIENQLKLLTIRHYNEDILAKQRQNKSVFLTQKGEDTVHYLMR